MAHYAKVENGIVTQVIVADPQFIDEQPDRNLWYQCSYNSRGGVHYDPQTGLPDGKPHLRYNYPGIGYKYHIGLDAFIPPKPYASWILERNSMTWKPPVDMPRDGKNYEWDDNKRKWKVKE